MLYKEKDTGTLQFDWFINDDKTECEIREAYESSEAALAHQDHLRFMGIITDFFRRFKVLDRSGKNIVGKQEISDFSIIKTRS